SVPLAVAVLTVPVVRRDRRRLARGSQSVSRKGRTNLFSPLVVRAVRSSPDSCSLLARKIAPILLWWVRVRFLNPRRNANGKRILSVSFVVDWPRCVGAIF